MGGGGVQEVWHTFGGGVQDLWQFVTGGGSKIIKKSVTYFMDGPLSYFILFNVHEKLWKLSNFTRWAVLAWYWITLVYWVDHNKSIIWAIFVTRIRDRVWHNCVWILLYIRMMHTYIIWYGLINCILLKGRLLNWIKWPADVLWMWSVNDHSLKHRLRTIA